MIHGAEKGQNQVQSEKELKIWDFFVRSFHWIVVAAFAVCYITEGEPRWLHVNSGYIIAGFVALRIIWGFAGPPHARFSDFVRSPRTVFEHLNDVVRFRAKRYLGHDPAGGVMIVALLVCLSLTAVTGMLYYAARDNAGPFAAWSTSIAGSTLSIDPMALAHAGHPMASQQTGKPDKKGAWTKEVHEFFANLTLVLVIMHVSGVVLVSYQTRENLIRSMIDGRKKVTLNEEAGVADLSSTPDTQRPSRSTRS